MSDNPFEVLRLDPSAGEAAVVEQAAWLRQRARDEAELNAIRQAVQELTGEAERRQWHALMTPPRPAHSVESLERLANAFRRPPTGGNAEIPDLDREEFAARLLEVAAGELELAPQVLELPAGDEPAEEVDRQSVEAHWQGRLLDPEA